MKKKLCISFAQFIIFFWFCSSEILAAMEHELVLVNLDLTQDIAHDNPAIKPKISLVNEKSNESLSLKDGDKVKAENYLLQIEMDGYEPLVSQESIMPSELPYKISKKLIASMRSVVTKITAEYPADKTIIPHEITLDNKPVSQDFKIKPGTHELVILKDGYMPIRKSIQIGANSLEYLLEAKLETKTRLVNFKFIDAILLDRELIPDEIFLNKQRLANASETLSLKPGRYNLKAYLNGYCDVDVYIEISVGEDTFTFQIRMEPARESCRIRIKGDSLIIPRFAIQITADFPPLKEIVPDVLTLDGIPVSQEMKVPINNSYRLVIKKEGYSPIDEKIEIDPFNTFFIYKTMIAKPRKISLVDEEDKLVEAHQILANGKLVSCDVKPGFEIDLTIQFKQYKTVRTQTSIFPGETPFVVKVPLKKLEKYEFNVNTNTRNIDGIDYTYSLYADDEPIEEHLIQIEKQDPIYYTIFVEKEVKTVKVFAGYLFSQRAIGDLKSGIGVICNIHVGKLIEHLEARKKGEKGIREVLNILEQMFAQDDTRRMIHSLSASEKYELEKYIEGLRPTDSDDRAILEIIKNFLF